MISPNNIPRISDSIITTKDKSEEFTFTQYLNENSITFDPDLDYKFTFDLANNETNHTIISNDFAICYINLSILNEIGIETVFMTEIKEIEFITV